MGQTVTIGEETKLPLKLVIALVSGIVLFTFWLTNMHFDVVALKKDMEQVKMEVHEVHQRCNIGKPGLVAGDDLKF